MNILKAWKANLQIADIINVHFCEITVCNAFSANYSYKTNTYIETLKKYHDFFSIYLVRKKGIKNLFLMYLCNSVIL